MKRARRKSDTNSIEELKALRMMEENEFSEQRPQTDDEIFGPEEPSDIQGDDIENVDTNTPHRKSKRKKFLLIFIIALITLFVLYFGMALLGNPLFNSGDDPASVQPVDKASGKINVLITGVDKDGMRSDTIILASYDLDNQEVNMLSIPRDTRMYVGGWYQKINAAHAISKNGKPQGIDGTIEAVTRLTTIPINYYVEFTFDAFRETIDAVDGVDYDVPQNMRYSDPTQDLYINLKKGYQHLDGDKAEQLVRFRQYPNGDIDRVAVQQDFIKAVAEQKLNLTIIDDLPELYETLSDNVSTNFTLKDVLRYSLNLKDLSADNIYMHQLPGHFSGPEYEASYWLADMDAAKTLIEEEFGYDASNATIDKTPGSPEKNTPSPAKKATASPKNSKPTQTAPASSPKSTKKPSAEPTTKATKKPTSTTKPKETDAPESDAQKEPSATKAPARPTQKPSAQPATQPQSDSNDEE